MSSKKQHTFELSLTLASKIGTALVHANEYLETNNEFDKSALESALEDKEVKKWVKNLGPLGRSSR